MKKIWRVIVFFVMIFGIWAYRYKDQLFSSFFVFPLENAELLFWEKWTTAKELVESERCEIAVNGSYFGKNEKDLFFPAGIWLSDVYHKDTPSDDPNLQNTIRWNQKSWKADFFFDRTREEVSSWDIAFNAGPWLLKKGELNGDLDLGISHWKHEVPRTVLVKNDKNQPFVFLSKKDITLSELANLLQEQGFIDAINLDGGPSTSFARKGFFAGDFHSQELLPIFFCWN